MTHSFRAQCFIGAIALTFLFSERAWSHARLKASTAVVPRNTSAGNKVGPCGAPRGAAPAVLQPGQTITVTWEETIQHPGRFEFYWSSANDQNFQHLLTVQDLQNGSVDLPHQYSSQLTIPSVPCVDCTLQMIQVMTETVTPSYYYSCADIRTQALTGPTPTPTPGMTPAPTVSPTPVDCPVK